ARTLSLGERPWLMGIVNATPDSFSDGGVHRTLEERVELARALLASGADVIDVGGESGVTNRPAVDAREEIARVVPLIERIADELGAVVSVDTYKPPVAAAAIAAGACIVNDVSGLRDPALADVCAETGAALVLMHTRAAPKQKLLDPSYDGRMAADVVAFLRERMALAVERGVAAEQLILDPGPDFGKTPAPTRAWPRSFAASARVPGAEPEYRARTSPAADANAVGAHRSPDRRTMPVLERSALADSPLADLHAIALEIGIDGFRRLRKEELIDAIVARQGGDAAASGDAAGDDEASARPRRR